jgi:hypothetical protein
VEKNDMQQLSSESHEYDNTLKALFGDEVAQILPALLPDSHVVGEENIETDRTKLKADLVYNVIYRGEPHILNVELQTNSDSKMDGEGRIALFFLSWCGVVQCERS